MNFEKLNLGGGGGGRVNLNYRYAKKEKGLKYCKIQDLHVTFSVKVVDKLYYY